MPRPIAPRLAAVIALILPAWTAVSCHAEIWTDSTGNFRIDAEYVGVQGRSVVLRKADGDTINVPIDRLSDESRETAKRLYEMSKSNVPDASTTLDATEPASATDMIPAPPSATTTSSSNAGLNFSPPTPPAVPPMPAFPENATLQETVDFVRLQALAGHPEVIWYALPDEVRSALDSDEIRSKLVPLLNEPSQSNAAVQGVVMKLLEVLVTKKQFVLGSQLAAIVPPPMKPLMEEAYDPAVGVLFEAAMLSFGLTELESKTFTQWLDDRGPRIGGHLQSLVKVAPPGMIDSFTSQLVVEQSDDDHGTITSPNNKGGTETTSMVRYAGRWLPQSFAEQWQANQNDFANQIIDQISAAKAGNAEAAKQAEAMAGTFAGMANGLLAPLLAATTQQQFDQGLGPLSMMIGASAASKSAGSGGVEVKRTFKDGVEVDVEVTPRF